ncbi:MAG: ABC transporter ATP-binding protein [Deltaproteobacteria bacterium]|nr:ABC transporter ATP-binding protein [Deltaproteobacteria bacterium]MBI3295894.1 ABC transporter ATP-binding protein [Deltaproteobacteria bacterium]
MTHKIRVNQLGKEYRLGAAQGLRHPAFVRRIALRFNQIFGTHLQEKQAKDSFWALNDISFDVKPGETVGIIGRNGSGKSTLLKILSRITTPTRGVVELNGHLSSLLEVGTGFHPELSGRENVFLNGALLGMTRNDIKNKFDEIVAFSEVAKFIDTPVKHYSSGMYVRLAFAVAAHLDPDILVVDEVLSVGDGGFQRKCVGKMSEAAKNNRTILFVSHNLLAVRALCSRVIVLDQGHIVMDGSTEDGISTYSRLNADTADLVSRNSQDRLARSNGAVRFTDAKIVDASGQERTKFNEGETVNLSFRLRSFQSVPSLAICVCIRSSLSGEYITTVKKTLSAGPVLPSELEMPVKIEFPNIALRPGDYSFFIWLGDEAIDNSWDVLDENVSFPWLTITSDRVDRENLMGYFTIPANFKTA